MCLTKPVHKYQLNDFPDDKTAICRLSAAYTEPDGNC